MLKSGQTLSSVRARELREAFDAAFAAPLSPPESPGAVLLILRVGGELLAARRNEMTGFLRAHDIAPTPGRSQAFTGLIAVRGEIYPVWNLAGLLDREQAHPMQTGWLVLAGDGDSICAFGVEIFEQMIHAPVEELVEPQAGEDVTALLKGAIRWNSLLVPVLSLPALLSRISNKNQLPNQTSI